MRQLWFVVAALGISCADRMPSTKEAQDAASDSAMQQSSPEPAPSPSTESAPAPAPGTPVAPPLTAFERQPYVLFAELPGGKQLTVIGAHLKPSSAVQEANWLDDVYEYYSQTVGPNAAILGDLNLSCDYASSVELASLDLRRDTKFRWLIGDDADTNVADRRCAYDRIIVAGDVAATDGRVVDDATPSDHYAVETTIGDLVVSAFNLQAFGPSKAEDKEAVADYAQVVCRADLALVQEIVSETTEPAETLLRAVRDRCGSAMEMKLSEPTGTTSYKERFAYIYRSTRLQVKGVELFSGPRADVAAPTPASLPPPLPPPPPASPQPPPAADCGSSPYKTPGGYCYATKSGKKVRVANSCCN